MAEGTIETMSTGTIDTMAEGTIETTFPDAPSGPQAYERQDASRFDVGLAQRAQEWILALSEQQTVQGELDVECIETHRVVNEWSPPLNALGLGRTITGLEALVDPDCEIQSLSDANGPTKETDFDMTAEDVWRLLREPMVVGWRGSM